LATDLAQANEKEFAPTTRLRPKEALSWTSDQGRECIVAAKDDARAGAEARFVKAKQKADAATSAMAEYAAAAAASATKTARLRALRLAKEAADLAAASAAKTPARRKKSVS
jgi:hypothetical protein